MRRGGHLVGYKYHCELKRESHSLLTDLRYRWRRDLLQIIVIEFSLPDSFTSKFMIELNFKAPIPIHWQYIEVPVPVHCSFWSPNQSRARMLARELSFLIPEWHPAVRVRAYRYFALVGMIFVPGHCRHLIEPLNSGSFKKGKAQKSQGDHRVDSPPCEFPHYRGLKLRIQESRPCAGIFERRVLAE